MARMTKKNTEVIANTGDTFKDLKSVTPGGRRIEALKVLSQRIGDFAERAKAIVKIRTQSERELVAALLVTNKDLQRLVHDDLDPQIANAYKTHQDLCALRHKHLKPLLDEEVRIKRMQNDDVAEQERVRREAQKKLDDAATKKAEAARKRELEALKKDDPEAARELAAAPLVVTAPQAVNAATATASAVGTQYRTVLHFEVEDVSKVDRKHLCVNEPVVLAAARALWKAAEAAGADPWTWESKELSGIRVYTKKESAAGGGR